MRKKLVKFNWWESTTFEFGADFVVLNDYEFVHVLLYKYVPGL